MVKLSDSVVVPYSEAERELFALLPVGGKNAITSQDLVEKRYGASAPFHARAIIVATVGNLARKVEANREPFEIGRTVRQGPHPIRFWIRTKKEIKEKA